MGISLWPDPHRRSALGTPAALSSRGDFHPKKSLPPTQHREELSPSLTQNSSVNHSISSHP